ncbi:unnamed protein product [Rangifer tarandus platyrhynchus]|uniref:Uncharacterized protein n=2 Tax=Rangifer tarandus platyrhynchus TaxID=3082113 RepID=A0ABN8Y346_RANTA|nr:unnamed protein product [Rangifer tarandus platyrhynchus]CAI9692969.1 unnamed protein product [Rangifer tarandus platyrhynchus]
MAFSSPQEKMHALSLTNFKAELLWVKDMVLKVKGEPVLAAQAGVELGTIEQPAPVVDRDSVPDHGHLCAQAFSLDELKHTLILLGAEDPEGGLTVLVPRDGVCGDLILPWPGRRVTVVLAVVALSCSGQQGTRHRSLER